MSRTYTQDEARMLALNISHARWEKAKRLAQYLADQDCTPEMAAHMTAANWALVAKEAGVRVPSRDTQHQVLDILAGSGLPHARLAHLVH